MNVKEIIRKIFYEVLSIINIIVPKNPNQILLYSNSELADSNEALALYMLDNCRYIIKCFTHRKLQDKERYDGIYYTNKILKLILWYFRSGSVVETHTVQVKMRPTKNQFVLQIWHGTPIKYMEYKASTNYRENIASFYTSIVYPSEKYKNEMARLFGAKDEQMILMGYPRNDLLFTPKHSNFLCTDQYNRVVAWLPTYRNSSAIGLENRFKKALPVICSENIDQLECFLRERNMLMIIKIHPLQNKTEIDIQNTDHIKIIFNKDLSLHKEPLYSLLAQTDALITDFSSVVFDYLLTDKPIGFCIDDFNEYEEKVGFCCVENIDELLTGPIIQNIDELITFLDSVYKGNQGDIFKDKRKIVREMANYYLDDGNSRRCVDEIEKRIKQ